MTLDQALIKGYSIKCEKGEITTTISLTNPHTGEEETARIPTSHLENPGAPAIHKALRKLHATLDI